MSNNKEDYEKFLVAPDRPPSLDQTGRRLFIIPAEVSGYFRKRRNLVYGFLIILFLVVPWTTFNGRQTIFLDISRRRFLFFDNLFFAHDAPLVFFLLAIAAFSIIFMTAVWGRVWCGWACPQTVFIDFIYRRIEEWTEGKAIQRRRLEKVDWTPRILFWKAIKWVLFFLASSHITHSAFAYFVGSKQLLNITLNAPSENWSLFVAVQVVTAVLLLNFGWFREQFCLIACPYGRLQSALMDDNSMAILYDHKRGEPRRQKGLPKESQGDCINCLRCVNVCPTGIDIREGLQMECIACTACADACDEIMLKVNKPQGLIRYASEAEIQGSKKNYFTFRNISYLLILLALFLGAVLGLTQRESLEVEVVRAIESPYQFANQEKTQIVNHFRVHLTNQTNQVLIIREIKVDEADIQVVSPTMAQSISPGQAVWVHVFLSFPRSKVPEGRLLLPYEISYEGEGPEEFKGQLILLAP